MKKLSSRLMLLAMASIGTTTFAQGCSDAGFCTIESLRPHDEKTQATQQLKIGAFVGKADHGIVTYGNYLEYNQQWHPDFGTDIKINTLAQSGNGLQNFGLSDILANAHYKINPEFKLNIGAKIPLNQGNKMQNGLALPMDYQASLGTLDLIVGLGYQLDKWQFVAAIQQPISQNDNQFLASNFASDSPLSKITSTRHFQRRGDVLLRASYPFVVADGLKITPSLLPIYHLGNDQYTDELGLKKDISGSAGLTLNANVYADYDISAQQALQLSIGAPMLVRKSRPDGLTRAFVANLEYKIRF
jgi:hypothetical protein